MLTTRRPLAAVLTVPALLLGLAMLRADQAKVEPGASLSDLSAGTHLYGPEFDAASLTGKVVVVNIGGG